MIVYGEDSYEANPAMRLRDCAAALRRLADARAPDHDLLRREVIRLGEVEAGLGDALCPRRDRVEPRLKGLRRVSVSLGRLLWRSWKGSRTAEELGPIRSLAMALEEIAGEGWPSRVLLRPPEGYAHYAVYPECYGEAAARIARSSRFSRAAVIGIRSIGTSLSAVVAGALEESGIVVESWCVRPHGHPFSRCLLIDAGLGMAWAAAGEQGASAVVVDEGPGLSGSSFLSVLRALEACGFPAERVHLMPSWDAPAPPMAEAEAAALWRRTQKAPADFEEHWRRRIGLSDAKDLSAGRWRKRLPAGYPWPAVQPQHERRKFLREAEDGTPRLWKFAGLGPYGEPRRARAEALCAAGFSPAIEDLRNGFLVQQFVAGQPLSVGDLDRRLADRAVAYLSFRARAFSTGRRARIDELTEMIGVNLSEGLGDRWRVAGERLIARDRAILEAATAAVDGRLMPHEWLRSPEGLLKTDTVDHADDHFFPRDQDIAWDVAGFCAEFRLNLPEEAEIAQAVAHATGDRRLPLRLPFYAVAYRAYQLGYAQQAAMSLGHARDAERFRRRGRRFRNELRMLLGACQD
jgi:hypothetical protein